MRKISIFNKIFLLFCAALFILLTLFAPHDAKTANEKTVEMVSSSE